MSEEIFDVVNDDDLVIGRASRSVVHATGLQHRGVHIFLFTPEGKMLVQQRSEDRHASPSSLDCSVSEHVQAGEVYLTAARRGLKEELGLEGIDLEPIVTFKMTYGLSDNEISRLFQGPLVDPSLVRLDPTEVESVDLASLQELQSLLAEGKRPLSHWFEQMLLWLAGNSSELQILQTHGALRPAAYSR
jgi:isopentenyl-diphosphate Delta-isomerase